MSVVVSPLNYFSDFLWSPISLSGAYLKQLFNPTFAPIFGNASAAAAAQQTKQACLWDGGSNKYKLQTVDPTT